MKYIFLMAASLFYQVAHAGLDANTICTQTGLELAENECEILVEFYNSSNGESWDTSRSWGDPDIRQWKGISTRDGHVFAIQIDSENILSRGIVNEPHLSGNLPKRLPELKELLILQLSGQDLRGSIPTEYGNFEKLQTMSLQRNALTGAIPDIFSQTTSLHYLDLSRNNIEAPVPSSITNNNTLKHVDLSLNIIRSQLPSFSSDVLSVLDLGGNEFYGEVPKSFSKLHKLTDLSLDFNSYLWGDISKWIGGLESLEELFIHGNHFWSSDNAPFRNLNAVTLVWSTGNHIASNLELQLSNQHQYINVWHEAQSMVKNQISEPENVTLNIGPSGLATMTPTIKDVGTKIFIVPDEGYNTSSVSGCAGKLRKNIYLIAESTDNCTINIVFSKCEGQACITDFGRTNSVSNARVETPSTQSVLSGVVQLRGWLNNEEWTKEFSWNWARIRAVFTQIDDGPKKHHGNLLRRDDVLHAMDLTPNGSDTEFAWSSLFYSGALSNGKHRHRVWSREGLLVSDSEFEVFNPDVNGKVEFIKNIDRSVTVPDFPIPGHKTRIAFNQAQQSFTIEDQLNEQGVSVASEERHYSSDKPTKSFSFGDNRISRIENPANAKIYSGVQSLRGWINMFDAEDGISYDSLPYFDIDGIPELGAELDLEVRSDVNTAYGYPASEQFGWSILGYSGQLKNGWHRARLQSKSPYGDPPYVYSESTFRSFTPLNELGEQFYVHSFEGEVYVEDFPQQGSDVILRFDPAGQNFTIVSQNQK